RPATLSGTWKFELDSAPAGGATSVLQRQASADLPGSSPATWPIFPTGWTKDGPVAMVGAPIATQNVWPGGPMFVINSGGQPSTRVGGGDCMAARILASGLVPCVVGPNAIVSVRDSGGQVVWQPSGQGFNALQLSLAPGASAVTDGHYVATRSQTFVGPSGCQAQGWPDA